MGSRSRATEDIRRYWIGLYKHHYYLLAIFCAVVWNYRPRLLLVLHLLTSNPDSSPSQGLIHSRSPSVKQALKVTSGSSSLK
jgi:hypothetical protein